MQAGWCRGAVGPLPFDEGQGGAPGVVDGLYLGFFSDR